MKKILTIMALSLLAVCAAAQSKSYNLARWIEIHSAVLKELNRSYVDSLPVDRMERAGLDAMLAKLDPYTVYIPQEENEDLQMMISKTYGGIGALIYKTGKDADLFINEPYAGSPAARNGLQCGDRILEIDGMSVYGLDSKGCSDRMKGKPGTELSLKVKKVRSDEVKDIRIVRERIRIPDVEYYGMLDDTTGYLVLGGFTDGVASEIRSAVQKLKSENGMKRFVLDLRGNGGGLMNEAVDLVSIFVPKGSLVVSSKGNEAGENREYRTAKEPVDLTIPVIVLVDSGSASASEIVSGALQDLDRATIMGGRTYGKGLVQNIRPLPYGGQMKVTVAKYYTPSGRCVQAIDYAHRNEDGSVGNIPDSLKHEFRTAHGRIVKDGGGVTPDVELEFKDYSRLTYSVVMGGIVEQYVMDYVSRHESIPDVDDFHFTEYEDFIEFARTKDFDYRSSARTYFDQMKKELRKDGIDSTMSEELDALEKAMNMDKEKVLRLKRDEIVPFIEEEIAVRYYFQQAGIRIRIRYDEQLKKALESPMVNL